jgi:putative membrane protein
VTRYVRVVVTWAINLAALWVAHVLFAGVHIHGTAAYLIGAAVLGVANTVLKPVLTVLTLPLVLVTVGLFLLVINTAMIALAAWATPNFAIHGLGAYVGTVVVVWLVNWAADALADRAPKKWRRRLRRQRWWSWS